MDTFEYLAVLFSIIVGLAVTDLLQGVRGLVVARRRVILFWPSLLRAAALMLVLVQVWWSVFGLRNLVDWTFGSYAVVLAHMLLLYLATSLALPNPADGEAVDMRRAYFADARPFYALMIAATGASVAKDLVIAGQLPDALNLAFHGAFAALSLVAIWSRRDRVHLAVTALLLAGFIGYVIALFDRLPR